MKTGIFQFSVWNGNLLYKRSLPFRRFPAEGRAQKPALPPQENETVKIFRLIGFGYKTGDIVL